MLSVQENLPVEFSTTLLAKFAEVVSRYPAGKQKSARRLENSAVLVEFSGSTACRPSLFARVCAYIILYI